MRNRKDVLQAPPEASIQNDCSYLNHSALRKQVMPCNQHMQSASITTSITKNSATRQAPPPQPRLPTLPKMSQTSSRKPKKGAAKCQDQCKPNLKKSVMT